MYYTTAISLLLVGASAGRRKIKTYDIKAATSFGRILYTWWKNKNGISV